MHIIGTIKDTKPEKSGVSQSGKEWRSKPYLVVYDIKEDFEKKLTFDVIGDNIEKFDLQVGKEYELDLDVTAREYNGSWFNSTKAYRACPVGSQPQQQQQEQPSEHQPKKMPSRMDNIPKEELEPKADDLPF